MDARSRDLVQLVVSGDRLMMSGRLCIARSEAGVLACGHGLGIRCEAKLR